VVIVAGFFLRAGAPQPSIMAASLDAFATPLPEAATYQVQRTRSDADAIVTLPDSPQAIRLRVRPALEPLPATYRVQLAAIADDDSLTEVAAVQALRLDGDGFVTLYVNSAYLQPGDYKLKLSSDADQTSSAAVNEFLLELVAADAPAAP
jgi:hypothetical protein